MNNWYKKSQTMQTPTDDVSLKMAEWLVNLYKGNTLFDNGVMMMITDKDTLDNAVQNGASLAAVSLGLSDVTPLAPYIQTIIANFYNIPEKMLMNDDMNNDGGFEEAVVDNVENVE
jgi:hypothetical protein